MNEIYLDHNATTPLAAEAAESMAACQGLAWGNPASQHAAGRRARQQLEAAREKIGTLLGARLQTSHPDRLVFTSGGTEANNLALFGLCQSSPRPGRLIVSAIEHPSVMQSAAELARRGWDVSHAPVTSDGVVDVTWIRQRLASDGSHAAPCVVSIMLGNNETGVLQPVEQIATICRAAGAALHTDAIQVAGKLPVDFHAWRVHALSISAHKFHGPRGIGALLLRHDTNLTPRLFGGFQQEGLRPGTECVMLAVGMHAALLAALADAQSHVARITHLRDELERGILAGYPGAVVHGARAMRLPHTSNISFPGLDRQALQMALDLAGVACSTGSACASGSTDPSPVLIAMRCEESLLHSSLRFSLGRGTTPAEIEEALRRILRVCKDLAAQNLARKSSSEGRQRG